MAKRSRIISVLVALALAAGAVSGCRSDDEPAKKADGALPDTGTATEPSRAERKRAPEESKADADRRKQSDREREERELEDLEKEDREFERSFEETPFEKLTGMLPIRESPLFIEQYITDGTSTLRTAVNEKRFLCKMAPGKRKQAVEDFYADADKLFKRGGVKRLTIVVTPLTDTAKRVPALATARNGSVSLTARGRGRGPC